MYAGLIAAVVPPAAADAMAVLTSNRFGINPQGSGPWLMPDARGDWHQVGILWYLQASIYQS